MLKIAVVAAAMALAGAQAQAQTSNGFDKLTCGADVIRVLKGQAAPAGTIVKLEEKYRHLQLEHLGADEIRRGLHTISWRICGKEYMTLESDHRVLDIIEFPAHDRTTPAFGGLCIVDGKESRDSFVGVLASNGGAKDVLPAKSAWRIDQAKRVFVPVAVATLKCSTDTIITVDMSRSPN